MLNNLKILIIRLSSMGDILLTTSLIRQLKNRFTDAKIDFVLSRQFKELLEFNPNISNLINYDKFATLSELVELKNEIKSKLENSRYDLVIDLQKNLRSKIFRSGLGDKYLFVRKRRLHKLSLVYFKKSLIKNIKPISEMYRLTADSLKVLDDNKGLELWLPDEADSEFYPPFNNNSKEKKINSSLTISIAPGAFHFTKRWKEEKFIELIDRINYEFKGNVILIGGVKDKEITDIILKGINTEVEDRTNEQSIIRTAQVIDRSDLLITNDTGVMHIAAARQVPVIAIFGSTVKEFGFAPFRVKSKIIEKELSCRPCTHIGKSKCPKEHFNCMNMIETEDIFNAIEEILGE